MQTWTLDLMQNGLSAPPRAGRMIVEGQAPIVLSLEAGPKEIGYESAGPFVSSHDELVWLVPETPGAAVPDSNLRDGISTVPARELRRRRILLPVRSGYRQERSEPIEFLDTPWIEKPYLRQALLEILGEMTSPLEASYGPGIGT